MKKSLLLSFAFMLLFGVVFSQNNNTSDSPAFQCGSTFSDVDGNIYQTVYVAGYCWMKSNLKVTHYAGDASAISRAMVYRSPLHPNEIENDSIFGRLYTWYSAVNVPENSTMPPAMDEEGYVRGACPAGWHIPTAEEMSALRQLSANSLRSTEHWLHPENNTNSSGYTALPAGTYNAALNRYENLLDRTGFWSVDGGTMIGEGLDATYLYYYCEDPMTSMTPKADGLSVRCVLGGASGDAIVPTLSPSCNVGDVNPTSATATCEVTSDGGASVTARGVCWGTSSGPTLADSHTSNGVGIGAFSCSMTGLTPNTTYYVRPYAVNGAGTAYGEEVTFTTPCWAVEVTISGATNLCEGETATLTASGAQTYAWNTGVNSAAITVNTSGTYTVTGYDGYHCPGAASKTVTVTSCATIPTVTVSVDGNSVTHSSATVTGEVTSDGGSPITGYGFCWGTGSDPDITGTHSTNVPGAGGFTGSFSETLTGLLPNTTYCVRSYATNSEGTSYGTAVCFTTPCWAVNVSITGETSICTGESTTLTASGASSYEWRKGTTTSDIIGTDETLNVSTSGTYYVKGYDGYHCPGTASKTVTVHVPQHGSVTVSVCPSDLPYNWHGTPYSEAGNYTYSHTDNYGCLQVDTLHLVLANCAVAPTVTVSVDGNSVTHSSATVTGEVTSDGGAPITGYGFCWGTGSDPDITGTHSTNVPGTGGFSGGFSETLTGLLPNTTYCVRSYATNSEGTSYGTAVCFTTPCWAVNVSITGETSICTGESTTLTASGASSYEWRKGTTTSDIIGTDETLTVSTSGTYYVKGYDGYHCPGTESKTVTVHVPQLTSLTRTACVGYVWERTNGTDTTITQSGTYIYKYQNSYGCGLNVDTLYLTIISCTPTVITNSPTNIAQSAVTLNGEILNTYSANIINSGFEWKVTGSESYNSVNVSSVGGNLTRVLSNLSPVTSYTYRAFVTTQYGTGYGNEVTFTTLELVPVDGEPCPYHETVTDIDNNVYNTVQIGNQCLMKENLRTTRYADGSPVGTLTRGASYYAYPNNNSETVDTYGYLYNWSAVMHGASATAANPSGIQGICPNGWHVPSYAEWAQLSDYVSSRSEYLCDATSSYIAKALAADNSWATYSGTITGYQCAPGYSPSSNNATGLSILPAGFKYGNSSEFLGFGTEAHLWSTTLEEDGIKDFQLYCAFPNVSSLHFNSSAYLSVRCVLGQGANLSSVTTGEVSNITTTSAEGSGSVISDGGGTVTSRGIQLSTSEYFSNYTTFASGNGTGEFSVSLTGLAQHTTYYVRAFATNAAGTAYGETHSFTTKQIPMVTTQTATNITTTSATLNGLVSNPDNFTITAQGFEWKPANASTYTQVLVDGTTMAYNLTGLTTNTSYKYRAFMTTESGTSYGSEITFTTLCNTVNISISGSTDICNGETATLTAEGAVNYSWSNGETDNTITISTGGTYTVTGWNEFNCSGSASKTVTVHTPQRTSLARTACVSYVWERTNGTDTTITQSGKYIYKYPNPYGCGVNVDTLHLTINSCTPSVNTLSPTDIAQSAAKLHGEITTTYFSEITNSGFDWKVTGSDNYNRVYVNHLGGNMTYVLSHLNYSTSYTYRAFVTTQYGTGYGNEVTFTTLEPIPVDGEPCPYHETVTDVDNNVYNTVQIGDQCWMKENLKTTHFADGSDIMSSGTIIQSSYTYPDGVSSNVYTYGYLYNWYAVMHGASATASNPSGIQGVCPDGWHVPSNAEWVQLSDYVRTKENWLCDNNTANITKALASDNHWNIVTGTYANSCSPGYSQEGNNISGFSALPAGFRYSNAIGFTGFGDGAYFWSTTSGDNGIDYYCIYHSFSDVEYFSQPSTYWLSVRCVLGQGANLSSVTTGDVSNITTTSAECSGNVTSDGGGTVTARGIQLSASESFSNFTTYASGNGTGEFTVSLTGLTPHTTYYVRAYATNAAGTAYGSVKSFTMAGNIPTLAACTVTDITTTGATFNGEVISDNQVAITARGFQLSTNINFSSYSTYYVGYGIGSFSTIATDLVSNTTYYVRAFATNAVGTSYSSTQSFRILTAPTITTNATPAITATTAMLGANITNPDNMTITTRGFEWKPTNSGTYTQVIDAGTNNSFTYNLTGLTPNTSYTYRAFISYNNLTVYGAAVSFTTLAEDFVCGASTVKDVDNNVYHTLQLGNQCWMAENLRTTKYADGTSISLVTTTASSGSSSTGAYRYYPNGNSGNVSRYGYLYNWKAVMRNSASSSDNPSGVQGVCPTGWHVPSSSEWTQLKNYVGSKSAYLCSNSSGNIAKALASKTGWSSSTTTCSVGNGTETNDATGFGALPAGNYAYNSNGTVYNNFGRVARYWCSTDNGTLYVYDFSMSYGNSTATTNSDVSYHSYGNSVRCVRNETASTSQTQPNVFTGNIMDLNQTSVTIKGTMVNPENVSITAQGFEWKTTTGGTYTQVLATGTSMSYNLTGLSANTSYTYRAFVTTGVGTRYGVEKTFTTLSENFVCGRSTVKDADNNAYNTVQLGNQCWMAENLRTTKYADGTSISLVTTTASSGSSSTDAYRYYPNGNSGNVSRYGYLYNWKAVMRNSASSSDNPSGVQGVCPTGWHVPSSSEWTQLKNYVGSKSAYLCSNSSGNIAKALASKTGWSSSTTTCSVGNGTGTNDATGFGALPAGNYAYNSNGTVYNNFGRIARYWCSTDNGTLYVYDFSMSYGNSTATINSNVSYHSYGNSVRCLRDETVSTSQTQPTVTTSTATNVQATTATLKGSYINPENVNIIDRGFEWKTTSGGTYTQVSATGTTMSYNLTGLTPNTSYTYRAYVTTSVGTKYGAEMTFTTLTPTQPTVTTSTATNITTTSATLNGSISNPDNVTITAHGFQWKTSTNGTYTNVSATGTTMSYDLSGLTVNTGYTYRAFVTTASGTIYGAERTFTTQCDAVTVTITGDLSICVGKSTVLTASTESPVSSYAWSTGVNSASITVSSWGVYSVTVSSENGCQGFASVSVVDKPSPIYTLNAPSTICEYTTEELSVTGYENTYVWNTGSTDQTITISNGGVYTVSATNSYGCEQSSSVYVTQLAAPTLSIMGVNSLCQGSSTTLIAVSDANQYLWSTGDNTQTVEVVPNNTTYLVTVTGENGCSSMAQHQIESLPVQHESVTVSECDSYTWHGQTYTESGDYTYPHTNGNGCQQVDTLHLTITNCVTALTPCTASATHRPQTGTSYQNNGFNGANYGLETLDSENKIISVTDYDGNEYPVVQIGSQCWFAQNLRVVRYSDGTPITNGGGSYSIVTGYLYNYSSSGIDFELRGYLYNYPAVIKEICPVGWHVPTDMEWDVLTNYVSSQSEYWCGNNSNAIAKAMSVTSGWNNYTLYNCAVGYGQGTNTTGFSAVPAGYLLHGSSSTSSCIDAGRYARFWSSTNYDNSYAKARHLYFANADVMSSNHLKYDGLSVRCLRDETGNTAVAPTATTSPATNLTQTSATLNASVTNPDNVAITAQGFQWKTTANGTYTNVSATGTTMSYNLTGLTANTSYTYRTFVTTAAGTTYGAEMTFATLAPTQPTVTTFDATDINVTSVTLNGSISNPDNVAITAQGFQWKTTANGTYANVSSTGTTMNYNLNDLTPNVSYTYRAFVTTASGTVYGTEKTFTTMCVPPYVTLNGPNTICENTTAVLSVLGNDCTYEWSTGSTNQSITISYGGVYTVTATNSYGCEISSSVYVTQLAAPVLSIMGVSSLCQGSSTTLVAVSDASEFIWNTSENTQSVTVAPTTTTTYSVTATGANGCSSVQQHQIESLPVQHESETVSECESYTWHGQIYTESGDYTYPHTDIYGCQQVDTLHLTITNCAPAPTYTCTAPTTHPAQTSSTYQNNGFNGANHGLETVNADGEITSVTDYDGNEYPVVQIGSQCWLAENMRCTHSPSTGTYIVDHNVPSSSNSTFTGKQARWYNNDSVTSVSQSYGLLYNWNAAVDVYNNTFSEKSVNTNSENAVNVVFDGDRQGICPNGWHIPSDAEWTTFNNYMSGQSEYQCGGNSNNIGKALASENGWNSYDGDCVPGNQSQHVNNSSGLGAIPVGSYGNDFYRNGVGAFFWSSTQYENTTSFLHVAHLRSIYYNNPSLSKLGGWKSNGYSVRCLRDESGNTAQTPTATTSAATNITVNSATLNGSVSNPDNVTITAQGFEWKTSNVGTYTAVNATGETMSHSLTGLTANTSYTYRAFVTTENGTSYGDEVTFTTTAALVYECSPYPCSAPPASQIDNTVREFDTLLFGTAVVILDDYDNFLDVYIYEGDTLDVHCGWIYKFNVEAGATYEWNTDISEGNVTPHGGNGLKTKITLFYDDFQTPAVASQSPVNTSIPTYAAGLCWKANYTGTVGVMVTRGDDDFDNDQDYCACNGDDLLLRYDKLANPWSNFMIWGRYGVTDTLPCDDDIHYIYDSGLGSIANNASGDYSNNENGYLVLYPENENSRIKFWGDCKLKEGDTLFIYNGDYSQNANLTPSDTIVGMQQLGNIDDPIFISQTAGTPITLRMQTDESCTWDGLELKVKCYQEEIGVTSTYPCTVTSTHPAQTGSTYQNNGFNGANHGLETLDSDDKIISVTDYDGNEYPVVQIGNQCWLAENMRCTHSPLTGTYIVDHSTPSSSNYTYTGKQARWYMGSVTMNGNSVTLDSAACVAHRFGLLYNWNAAVDVYNTAYGELSINTDNSNAVNVTFPGNRQGICPSGWHVPSDAEWNTMEAVVSGSDWQASYETSTVYRGSYAGKLAGGDDWNSSTTSGSPGDYTNTNRNYSGFAAVPAGYFFSSFINSGSGTNFWSSSRSEGKAWYRLLRYGKDGVCRYNDDSYSYGFSVRCLRDENGGTAQVQPTVTTSPATNLTSTSATLNGSITNSENAAITAQGFEWKPTTGGTYAQVNATGTTMTYSLTGLTANTSYTCRAFVTTASGTNYGEEVTFTTPVGIYGTGFESDEGFTAQTFYNNLNISYFGPDGQQWGTRFGAVSTNSSIFGSQSMQMRWYTTYPDINGYAFMDFDLRNATSASFSAKSMNMNMGLVVSYSIDGGQTFTGDSVYSLTTQSQSYRYEVSPTGEYDFVRLRFQLTLLDSTTPSTTCRVILDSINVFGHVFDAVETPMISKESCRFYDSLEVTITCATEDAVIRYTLDGTEPSENSTVYSGAITISNTTTLKAKAWKQGLKSSFVKKASFYRVPLIDVQNLTELRNKLNFSDIFVSVIDTVEYRITGNVIVTSKTSFRNYKTIQDGTAAIQIFDPDSVLGDLQIGDEVSGICGKLENYYGYLELVPTRTYERLENVFQNVEPLVITLTQLGDTTFMNQHQSELIILKNAILTDTANFAFNTRYNISQSGVSDPGLYPCGWYVDADYIGQPVPAGQLANITGFAFGQSVVDVGSHSTNNTREDYRYYIVPRFAEDIHVLTQVSVTTSPATNITSSSATLNGTITNPDNVAITAKGFEYKRTVNGTYTQLAGTGNGNSFTANLTGLTANTSYTYRAFITYGGNTIYGDEVTLTTIDGNVILSEDFSAITDSTLSIISLSLNDYTQMSGWTGDWVYPSNGKVRVGKSSLAGFIQTPSLDLSGNNGQYIVTFDVKVWENDTTSIVVSINDVSYTVSGLSSTEFNTFSLPIVGGASSAVIKFQGSKDTRARFFLDNVVVSQQSGSTAVPPTVNTDPATDLTQTSATLNGSVSSPDNVTVTAKGFDWKTTVGGTYTLVSGTGAGSSFTASLTGLTANTSYTYRAFVTYGGITFYGNEQTFVTLTTNPVTGTIILNENFSAITDSTSTIITNSLDSYTQMPGWTGDWVFPSTDKVKVGKSAQAGYIQTPSLNLSANNGQFVLTFDARSWTNDATSLYVVVDGTSYTVEGLNSSTFTTFSLPLTGGTSSTTIKFLGFQDSKSRFFLDNVVISQ